MKFDQLIQYNRNIFHEKLYRKCGGKTICKKKPFQEKLFLKNQNSAYLWINRLKFYYLIILYTKFRAI